MIIRVHVTGRGSKVVMRDDGSRKLLMKTVQESLRDGDKWYELIVIVCKLWLGWEEKLCKFWEEQSRPLEGKVGMLCIFFRMNG